MWAAQAMVEQMQRDHALLRARIQRLGGPAGIARLGAALAAVRANAPATPPSPPRVSPRGTPPRTPAAAPPQASLGAKQRDPNEALAWELLYDAAWHMPTTELDALWQDATGATGEKALGLLRQHAKALPVTRPAHCFGSTGGGVWGVPRLWWLSSIAAILLLRGGSGCSKLTCGAVVQM